MLILLRQIPDIRIQDLILSIRKNNPVTVLVYLERVFDKTDFPLPLVLSVHTYSMDAPPNQEIAGIDGKALLELIHAHPQILVLP